MVGPSHRVLDGFGHVEWEQNEVGPEIVFPAAPTVAAAVRDSRFASAVLATVAKSLLFARSATEHAKVQAGRAADAVRWAAECPPDVSLCRWLQRKRRERDTGGAFTSRPDQARRSPLEIIPRKASDRFSLGRVRPPRTYPPRTRECPELWLDRQGLLVEI